MHRWGPVFVLMLLLAGCAGQGTNKSIELDQVGDINLGGLSAVKGRVISEELTPLTAALVQVDNFQHATVDESGNFEIDGLPDGRHILYAGAPGYTFVSREIDLVAGVVLQSDFTLAALPSLEPYIEIIVHRGYSFCDTVSLLNAGEDTTCYGLGLNSQDDQSFNVTIGPTWQFVVTEVTWDPNFAQGADAMRVAHAPGPSCSGGNGYQDATPGRNCYGVHMAGRYVKLEGHPGNKSAITMYYDTWQDYRNQKYPDGPFTMWVLPQWAGWGQTVAQERCDTVRSSAWQQGAGCKYGYGVGISTGITINSFVSIFHNHRPPQPNDCCPTTEYTAVEG